MERRRVMLAENIDDLPAGYTRLPYIFSDGRQYIDSEIIPSSNDICSIDFRLIGKNYYVAIMGSRSSTNSRVYNTLYSNNDLSCFAAQIGDDYSYIQSSVAKDTARHKHTIDIPNRSYSIDSDVLSFSNLRYTQADLPYFLFAISGDNNYIATAGCCFEAEIMGRSHLIPCFRNSDGDIGMFDTLSKTFHANAGSAKFHQTMLYQQPYADDAAIAISVSERRLSAPGYGEIQYDNGLFTLTRKESAAGLSIIMGGLEANETYRISGTFGNTDGKMYIAKAYSMIRSAYSATRTATKSIINGSVEYTPSETGVYEFLLWNSGKSAITAKDVTITKISP